jgi:hypothetical protein
MLTHCEVSHVQCFSDERLTGEPPTTEAVASRLMELLRLRDCWYEPFPFDAQLPRIETGRIELPAVEPGIKPWDLDSGIELPVRLRGLTLGRFVLVPSTRTCGVALLPASRTEAIKLAQNVAPTIAARLIVESENAP